MAKRWHESKGFLGVLLLTIAWLGAFVFATLKGDQTSASELAGHFPYVAGGWSVYLAGQKYVDGEHVKRNGNAS